MTVQSMQVAEHTKSEQTAAERQQRALRLLQRWSEHGDRRSRDELALLHLPLISHLVACKLRSLPQSVDRDDLVQTGMIALLETIDRYDPSRGSSFEAFAWTRINGALVDALRSQDWAPRSARREIRAQRVESARLAHRLGREPSLDEVAAEMQVPVEDLRAVRDRVARAEVGSLQAEVQVGDDGSVVEAIDLVPDSQGWRQPDLQLARTETTETLRVAIADLADRERQILSRVMVGGESGRLVGADFGVSESRISQIASGIREKLALALRDEATAERSEAVAA